MKALILSGGRGIRLRPLTHTIPKQLVPVANKPILHYVIENVVEAGIKNIGIIIDAHTGNQIKEYVLKQKWRQEVFFEFITQSAPLGLAHAVKIAQDFIKDDKFLVYLGDNLIGTGITEFKQEFKEKNLDALLLLKKVKNPHMFGVVKLDSSGHIQEIIEKPKEFISPLALVGIYFFSPQIFLAIESIKPSWRGELEITDAIKKLLEMKKNVHSKILQTWWIDTGKKDDLLTANILILRKLIRSSCIEGKIEGDSLIEGRIVIEKGSNIINSTIKGSVVVGKNVRIENSYVGPYVSIGDGCKIINSHIVNSVILENCVISNVKKMEASLIGKEVRIIQDSRLESVGRFKFTLSDNSEVHL